jgi:hypothetical protein
MMKNVPVVIIICAEQNTDRYYTLLTTVLELLLLEHGYVPSESFVKRELISNQFIDNN